MYWSLLKAIIIPLKLDISACSIMCIFILRAQNCWFFAHSVSNYHYATIDSPRYSSYSAWVASYIADDIHLSLNMLLYCENVRH